jgi:hypothetical protein
VEDREFEAKSISDVSEKIYNTPLAPGGTQSGTPGEHTQTGPTHQGTAISLPVEEEHGLQLLETLKRLFAALSPEQRRQLAEWLTCGES